VLDFQNYDFLFSLFRSGTKLFSPEFANFGGSIFGLNFWPPIFGSNRL
jgi:hypothetical protein